MREAQPRKSPECRRRIQSHAVRLPRSAGVRAKRLGALLVGYYDDGRLRYAGKVGTGFDRETLEMLGDELEKREIDAPPFDDSKLPRAARWARPELVAQIGFTEWTRDGRLRHPRYLGLRDDKAAREVIRERPRPRGRA